jgi:5-hydroxyisourate hydrolase-like protein (transthyretin family)
MPLEILLSPQFQLHTSEDDNLNLVLPIIQLNPVDNIPHLSRITCTVTGTPEQLAAQIQGAYKEFVTETPTKLSALGQLKQNPCILDKPLVQPANCTLQVVVEYFDSDAEGNPLKSARRYIAASCYLWFTNEQYQDTPITTMSNQNNNDKRFPGWLAIDFGTSNSTVTLFDPREVPISEILPQEQEDRLRKRLSEWLGLEASNALPDVNVLEWQKFLAEISKNLEVEPSQLSSVISSSKSERFLEAIKQIELCLGISEKFRRAVSKKLYEIYHEVFRVPTLESQNLIPVILDFDRRATEISSELEIVGLSPAKVIMGEEAKANRNKTIAQGTATSSKEIISRFHHSPKRYFGQEREFRVNLNGTEQTVTAQQMMQLAWGHLKELTQKDRDRGRRKFSDGEFRTAVVTYPTVAPPIVRKQVKELVEQLGIDDVQIAYDEAVSVAIFFLWREFGGNLSIGIESFKTRCHYDGNKWSQNVLILDIGGGTTDLALIELTLEDKTPAYNKEEQSLGGRYYKLTPKLLGSSGHLQLGGEYITLRVFRLLKVALADRLLTELVAGNLVSDQLEDVLNTLDERFIEKGQFKSGSLLKCLDKENPESSPAYKDALDTAEKIIPTNWLQATQRLQSFYLLWEQAERAKLQLGQKPSTENAILTFTLDEAQISPLLAASGVKIQLQNPNNLYITLDSIQFERAAIVAVKEAIGIAKGLIESRLGTQNNISKGKVDWLILSGKTCNLNIVQREIYQEFSKSDYFVWNPERITFDLEFTKLATSAGACYAEKLQRLRFNPEESKQILSKGGYQVEIDVKNLFYYLPCNFKRLNQTEQSLPIFKAGQELYQLSLTDTVAKVRTEWQGVQLSNIIHRQDFENGEFRLWGSFDGNKLRQKLGMTEQEFLERIKVQFEIDQNLQFNLLLVNGRANRLMPSHTESIDVNAAIQASGIQETTTLFNDGKLRWNIAVGRPDQELNNGDIAVNVLESASVDLANGYYLVFQANNTPSQPLEFFRYEGVNVPQQATGLISDPLPSFPRTDKHTFYIYHQDSETGAKKWIRVGELKKPQVATDYPCQYRVTLDEKGILRMHTGEVPYWKSDSEECLKQEGCVFQAPLELQKSEVDKERDPFCGLH